MAKSQLREPFEPLKPREFHPQFLKLVTPHEKFEFECCEILTWRIGRVEWRHLEDTREGWGLVSNNVAGFAIAIAMPATARDGTGGHTDRRGVKETAGYHSQELFNKPRSARPKDTVVRFITSEDLYSLCHESSTLGSEGVMYSTRTFCFLIAPTM